MGALGTNGLNAFVGGGTLVAQVVIVVLCQHLLLG